MQVMSSVYRSIAEFFNGTSVKKNAEGEIVHTHRLRVYNAEGTKILRKTTEQMIESPDGSVTYLRNGRVHRDNGPALTRANGEMYWYQEGQLHREDGPAAYTPGSKSWYCKGKLHREDGPAVEWIDGTKEWYQHGQRHREGAAAIERPDGRNLFYNKGEATQLPPKKPVGVLPRT